jgi:predicted TIM-barrel fold metal-dependent hydrolase
MSGCGLPDTLVIDGHVHVGEWPHNTTFHGIEAAIRESAAFMDANGVDLACTQGGGYMWAGADYRLGNDFLLDVCRGLPDRMIGFMSVNPNDTWQNIEAELDRCYDAGIRCIKLINAYQYNYPGDGPNLMQLYAYADEHNMLVFNHAWAPEVIRKVADRFPATDFIFGHYHAGCDPVLQSCSNVYANIWSYGSMGWLDRGIATVGAAKFLMGSDAFLNPMSLGIGPVVFAPVPDDEKRLILGITQARLLDKVQALPAWVKETYAL